MESSEIWSDIIIANAINPIKNLFNNYLKVFYDYRLSF